MTKPANEVDFCGTAQRQTVAGDVFQINERHGRGGWIGAFVMATEVKTWGIIGFVSHIATHEEQHRAYIRLPWDQIDFVGHAPLVLSNEFKNESADENSDTGKIT